MRKARQTRQRRVSEAARVSEKDVARAVKRAERTVSRRNTGSTSRERGAARSSENRPAKRYVIRDTINTLLTKPLATGALMFCALALVVGVFLYPTARTYYQAVREQARLEAEFAAVLERNQKMADDIAYLQTDEGIVQEARETLGWVERGDNAVIVYGSGLEDASAVDADIVAGTVKAPVTWYSPVLDVVFGVE